MNQSKKINIVVAGLGNVGSHVISSISNINKNLSELMINSCSNLIKDLCGSNLFIQRKL